MSNDEQDKPLALVLEPMALKKLKPKTGIAKFSDSRSLHLGTNDLRHQKSSPNGCFPPEKSLLYMCSTAAILLLGHNLNIVPVLFALKCTDFVLTILLDFKFDKQMPDDLFVLYCENGQ